MLRPKMLHILIAGAFGALAVTATGQTSYSTPGNPQATMPPAGAAQTAPAKDDTTTSAQGAGSASDAASGKATTTDAKPDKGTEKKHPPTAVMDEATPTQKPSASDQSATGHGPTSVMDRATPQEKSPGTAETPAQPDTAAPSNIK